MNALAAKLGDALLMAFGMFWNVGWSLALGFLISALLQVFVSKERMQKALGRNGAKEIALATLYGAASSSCSYASASISRTLFKKGAALIPSLAFLLASTNLVVELGIVLYLLMGWQFTLAEWAGGLALVIIMAILVKLTYPAKLVFEARRRPDEGMMHEHDAPEDFHPHLRDPATRILVAQIFAADFKMLAKDLAAGFLIAGFLAAFVPVGVWEALFLKHAAGWVQLPANAVIGALIAVFSFVCSIGNVPMAAVLRGSGISFGGVLAFLYADLIVLPLLDVYRRYYGWKMASYIAGVFFVTMVLAALLMDVIFNALGWVPAPDMAIRAEMTHFAFNYTFALNVIFGSLAAWLFILARRHPMPAHHAKACCH